MPAGSALLLLLALVGAATVAGLLWRSRTGVVRAARPDAVTPVDLGTAEPFGSHATLVQFSTRFCAQCPAARRVLGAAADRLSGVRHVEIDLTDRPDIATRFNVLQTPTVLLLDGAGVIRGRIAGAPRPGELDRHLSQLIPGRTTR